MEWLNYHHLLYFWAAAREGSISRASEELLLSQPTVSAQIRALEEALGEKLFTRVGRHLVLTDVGRTVFRYADEIFSLGRELMDTIKGRPTGQPVRFTVGIADVVPKLNRTTRHWNTAHPVTPVPVILNGVKNLTVETLHCAQGDKGSVRISWGLI